MGKSKSMDNKDFEKMALSARQLIRAVKSADSERAEERRKKDLLNWASSHPDFMAELMRRKNDHGDIKVALSPVMNTS